MSANVTAQQAMREYTSKVVDDYSSKLRSLLEDKHLYQRIDVLGDLPPQGVWPTLTLGQQPHFNEAISEWTARRLKPSFTLATETILMSGSHVQVTAAILLVTNVKLFCTVCSNAEVFFPLWAKDAAEECVGPHHTQMPRKNSHQLFFLAFQCQRCHSDPEGFIIRRRDNRLFLEGRSPIEHVEVPKYLPKREAKFFSDAVVAYNAGKKLAAIFYLRTFLEQFAKRMTGKLDRVSGEELMEAYAATLPHAHRDSMPSFRELYEKLSEAMHAAREDDTLFESARCEIDRHFDIRRVFRILDTQQVTIT